MRQGHWRGRSAPFALSAALGLTACNALFGIEDASVEALGPAESGAAGAPAGPAGGAAGAGSGGSAQAGAAPGGGGAGAGAGAGGGQAATTGLDRSFGELGIATLRPTKIYAQGYQIAALYLQPTGAIVIAGSARVAPYDPTNTNRATVFAARLDGAGAPDEAFGTSGLSLLEPATAQGITSDFARAATPDPEGGLLLSFRFQSQDSYYPEDSTGFGVIRLGHEGQKLSEWRLASEAPSSTGLFAYGLTAPVDGCFAFNDAEFVGDTTGTNSIHVAACGAGFASLPYAALALPGGAAPVSGLSNDPAHVDAAPPLAAGGAVFVPLGDTNGRVGVAKLARPGAANLAFDPSFGAGNGYAFGLPDAFAASAVRAIRALAVDPAGNVYLAGETQLLGPSSSPLAAPAPPPARAGDAGPTSLVPFLAKFRADGVSLDAAFGANGTAQLLASGSWSCLLVDAQGRLLAGGSQGDVRGGAPVLARVTPVGTLDPTFGEGGLLALPFEPQRCAFDAEGRVLLAGARNDAFGVPTVALARAFNADGPAPPGPPLGATPSCASLDETEPDGDRAQATPMLGPRGSSNIRPYQTVASKGLLDGAQDVDWFHYTVREGSQLGDSSTLRADLSVETPAYLCLYVNSLEDTLATSDRFACAGGAVRDDATVPGYVGCCNVNAVTTDYTELAPPPRDLDVFLRVNRTTPQAEGRCDLYSITSGL